MRNELYPVFLKVSQLNVLIVGAGNVAIEKLHFLLKSSPSANVTILAPEIREEISAFENEFKLKIIKKKYARKYLKGNHIVIGATGVKRVHLKISKDCKRKNILVNIADVPEYCDFYLGGIVTRGQVKVAISTNGKSPTLAKRLRQLLEDILPENINDLAENINSYRKTLKTDLEEKVDVLNTLTESLIKKK